MCEIGIGSAQSDFVLLKYLMTGKCYKRGFDGPGECAKSCCASVSASS